MAIAHVNRAVTATAAAATTVASPATAHTTGNLLVALIQRSNTVSVTGVADTAGNTYHKAGSTGTGAGNDIDIWYAYNITGNASNVVTATFSGSIGYRAIVVHQFSAPEFGGADPYATGSQVSATGSGTALSSGTSTFTGPSAVIVALFIDSADSIVDTSPAYNTIPFNATGDAVNYFADGYRIVSASEAAVATGANSTWLVNAAAFQIVSTGPGPSPAYVTWAALPHAERSVLGDIQAGRKLRGWTSAGSGAYSIPYDSFSHPTTARRDRGLYFGCDSVREDGADLTVRANLAAVQANAGSFFFDEPNQALYVKTSGGGPPDLVSSMLGIGRFRVATDPKHFDGIPPYDAQIDGDSLPSLLTQQADPLLGLNTFPMGDLTLVNSDGFWHTIAAQSYSGLTGYVFTNMTVTFRLGGGALAFSDYQALPPMQIVQPPASKLDTCSFQLRSFRNATDTAFPQNTFGSTLSYGALTGQPALKDLYLPMFWGTVFSCPTVRLDIYGITASGGHPVLNVIDPAILGSTRQLNVLGGRVRNKQSGLITELAAGQVFYLGTTTQIDFIGEGTYPLDDYDLFVDCQLAVNGTGVPVVQTFGAIAHDVLTFCGVPDAQIDLTALAAADAAAPQVLGLYVPGGTGVEILTSGQALLNRLERSVNGSVQPTQSYPFSAKVWDPSFNLANIPIVDESDLLEFDVDDGVSEQLAAAVVVQYAAQVGLGTFSEARPTSGEARADLGNANPLTIETCLAYQHDAETLASRALLTAQLPTLKINAVATARLLTALPWDKYRVVAKNGPSTTSGSFDQILEVIALNKRLADFTVAVTFGNQRGLGESVKAAAPAGTPDWASATADQRRQYAFATDTLLYRADVSDPASFRPGVAA